MNLILRAPPSQPKPVDLGDYDSGLERKFGLLWEGEYPDLHLQLHWKPFLELEKHFDFAHLPSQTAIEIQGGIWMAQSGHNTGKGIMADMDKLWLAQVNGWDLFQLCEAMFTEEYLAGIAKVMRGDMISE